MQQADSSAARAVWFPAARTVELRDEAVPPPGVGELRVSTIVSGISHGTERLVFRGEVPAELPLDLSTLRGGYGFPIKYGYAAVGRVTDIGPGVTSHAVGDVVFALHPHQTVFVIPAALATRLPDKLDPLAGVFTANLETAVNIALDAAPRLGETAVVFGLGTVGLLAAQTLRLAGARRVFAVEPSAFRRDLALLAGVDAAFAPGDARRELLEANGGRPPDLTLEASGAASALQAAIDCVADEGSVVVASWYGSKPLPLLLGGQFHRGRVRLRSSQVGRLDPALAPRWDHARRMETVLDLLPRLRLMDFVTHRLPFDDAAQAYRLLDGETDELGQIVLEYNPRRHANKI